MKKTIKLVLVLILGSVSLFAQEATILFDRRPYYIQSAINFGKDDGGYWDLPGYPKTIKKRMNLAVYNFDDHKDRKFYMIASDIDGYYEIKPGWEKNIRIDVAGGKSSMKKNGANLHTWTKNGENWQKFRFKHLGNGRFRIYTTSGMVVCLSDRRSKKGTNIHLWEDHNGDWMDWYLIDISTKKPFIPKEIAPYDMSKPDFFIRNKEKTFVYKSHLAFGPGMTGTAKVTKISGNTITLKIEGETVNQANGEKITRSFEYVLNYREDGFYWNGNWDIPENSRGKVKVEPDGKQILELSGEQLAIEFIVEAD